MWTPKRLLLLLLGFVLFFSAYQVYVLFLGRYDGLPPLPAEYLPSADASAAPPPVVPKDRNHAEAWLALAFGSNCEELHRRIKLEWRTQGVVMAADGWRLNEGQLRLTRVSVAIIGKPRPDSKVPDINTIRGEQADIEFDKPLVDLRDATNRKPVAGTLRGRVLLRNNRRTAEADDDVRVYTDWLAYRDADHLIWTDAEVRLVDGEPAQATVTATGLEVLLLPGEPRNSKDKTRPSISGVKHVKLQKDVCMDLLVDGRSAFLGPPAQQAPGKEASEKPSAPPASDQKPAAKTPVVVTSQGPFVYTVASDPEKALDRAEFRDRVNVIRKLPATSSVADPDKKVEALGYDQLDCDHLVLEFRRKRTDSPRRITDDQAQNLELAQATAVGEHLELISDLQRLHATGKKLVYDKLNNETTMTGDPIEADVDGHHLRLRGDLVLQNPTGDKREIQGARAIGPGMIRMRSDSNELGEKSGLPPAKDQRLVERSASWEKELQISKDGDLDKLVLRQQAVFEDQAHGALRADQITVWIQAQPKAPGTAPSDSGKNHTPQNGNQRAESSLTQRAGNRVPRRLEAIGGVTLDSKDLKVVRSDRFVAIIEDAPVETASAVPSGTDVPKSTVAAHPPGATNPSVAPDRAVARVHDERPAPGSVAAGQPNSLTGQASPMKPGKGPEFLPSAEPGAREPITLHAAHIEVKLHRDGKKLDVRDVRTEGQVQVTQKAASGDGKLVDIRGDRLDLTHAPNGNTLKVVGQPAFVQLDRLKIIGPIVNIDQIENVAWVNGAGSMKMPAKTDFQGNALKTPVEVTIYWQKRMWFDGKYAEFEGAIQADQGSFDDDGAKLRCEKLEVVLDRIVSLREKQPGQGEQPAALHRLFCEQNVSLEKGSRKNGKWEEYQRIEGREVSFDNPSSELSVYGPGIVYLLHGDTADTLGSPPAAAPEQRNPNKRTLKLTQVSFDGHMQANKATNVVVFSVGVQLVHVPAEDPMTPIDVDRLPPGGLWLSCGLLKGLSDRNNDKRGAQVFEAKNRVRVKAQDCTANADLAKYEESKDLLILEGTNGNLATLWRQKAQGVAPEPVRAKKMLYFRKDNRVKLDETDAIQVQP